METVLTRSISCFLYQIAKRYVRHMEAAQWQIIYAGRKMQRNLTTDTICQNLLLRSVTSKLTLKKEQWREKKCWEKGFRQRHSVWFRLACNAKKQGKGGGRETGRCGKTSNWPPLWIFPNTGYYITVSFWYNEITAKVWQWREIQRRWHCYSVLVSRLARKQPFKGLCRTTGWRGRKRNERRNKETLESRQLVNEWKYTTSHSGILNHTDRDRKRVILIRLNQMVFRHHEIYCGKKQKAV